jgi:hypothetical protein
MATVKDTLSESASQYLNKDRVSTMLNKQNPSGASSPSMTPQNIWHDRENSLFFK